MMDRKNLARKAIMTALKIRLSSGVALYEPLSIFDFVEEHHNVEVRFADLNSMEGMYSNFPKPVILIGSGRPSGRQAFTCAHEFAHHTFHHGINISALKDEQIYSLEKPSDSNEYMADCFAGELLMPQIAVYSGFNNRGWQAERPLPAQLYTISGWLGVSYSALIHQMRISHEYITWSQAKKLLAIRPAQIKEKILGQKINGTLVIADSAWTGRALDIQVGDFVIAPSGTILQGSCAKLQGSLEEGILLEGVDPGIGRLVNDATDWSAYLRVSRKGYAGLNKFKHLEEIDDV